MIVQTNFFKSLQPLLSRRRFDDLLDHRFHFGLFDGFRGLDAIFLPLLLLWYNLENHPVGRGNQFEIVSGNHMHIAKVYSTDGHYSTSPLHIASVS